MPTITGTIEKADGTPFIGNVKFTPLNTPVFVSGTAVFSAPVYAATNEDGEFSITLHPNRYQVEHRIGDVSANRMPPMVIRVSNEAGPFDFEDIVETSLPGADFFGGLP